MTPPRKPFNPYPWMVGIALFTTLIVNLTILTIALGTDTDSSVRHPWHHAAQFGDFTTARDRFQEQGLQLITQPLEGQLGIELQLQRSSEQPLPPGPIRVSFFRQSDQDLDRNLLWNDPSKPLPVPLPARGLWRLDISTEDAAGLALAHRETLVLP